MIKIGRVSVSSNVGGLDGQDYLQHAQFVETSDGEVGVIFVADNNIFHQPYINNRKNRIIQFAHTYKILVHVYET